MILLSSIFLEVWRGGAKDKKQGSAGFIEDDGPITTEYLDSCNYALEVYEDMLEEGIALRWLGWFYPSLCTQNGIGPGSLDAFC